MKKINVLMIDDNLQLVDMVKEYFSKHEVINLVLTAVNGSEGLDYILNQQDKYDLIMITLQESKEEGVYNHLKMDMFFHLNIINHVKVGECLARLHPEDPGEDGKDVYGNVYESPLQKGKRLFVQQ